MLRRAGFLWFLGLAAALPMGPAQAQQWDGYRGSTGCNTGYEYRDGTRISFGLSADMTWSSMSVWNRRWTSIADNESFTIRAQLDDGRSFQFGGSGMVTSRGSHGVFTASRGLDFITGVMGARWLRLWNGSELIGQYSLAGSRQALLDAARCTRQLTTQPRPDPFAN